MMHTHDFAAAYGAIRYHTLDDAALLMARCRAAAAFDAAALMAIMPHGCRRR